MHGGGEESGGAMISESAQRMPILRSIWMKTITVWWVDDFTWTYRWNYEAEQGWIYGGSGVQWSQNVRYEVHWTSIYHVTKHDTKSLIRHYMLWNISSIILLCLGVWREVLYLYFVSINVIGSSVFRIFSILRSLSSRLRWWIYTTSHVTTISSPQHQQESLPESGVRKLF